MIELKNVRKSFNSGRPNEFEAIRGIDLVIKTKQVTVFDGPSGSGKSTLLSLIGCMSRPTSGRIWLEGKEITSLPERFLAGIRRKTFGFIFQKLNLIRGITALENAMLPAYPTGENHHKIEKRCRDLFARFDIGQKVHSRIEWLSGGEAQRVAIVRALVNDPSIIIADEPTAHLDSKLSLDLLEILGELKRDGKTVLFASHDSLVQESGIVDRIVNLRDGRIEVEAE